MNTDTPATNRLIYKGQWQFSVRKEFVLDSRISIGAKMLYIALRSFCAPDGDIAFPSVTTLAKALDVSRDTLYRYTNELKRLGLLDTEQSRSDKGGFSKTVYTLYDEINVRQTEISCRQNAAAEEQVTKSYSVATEELHKKSNDCPASEQRQELALNSVQSLPLKALPNVPVKKQLKQSAKAPSSSELLLGIDVAEPVTSNAESQFKLFVEGWCEGYKKKFGSAYAFQGAKDAQAVKRLLETDEASSLLALVSRAWEKTDAKEFWNCVNRTMGIANFSAAINTIRGELYKARKRVGVSY